MPSKSWSDEDVALLRKLLGQGLKRRDVVTEFKKHRPTCNRNSIAGAIWRHCRDLTSPLVKKRAPYGSVKREKSKPGFLNFNVKKPSFAKELSTTVPEVIDLEIPLTQRKTLLELNVRRHCRWPVNDPKDGNFFYCGGDRLESSVYCAAHTRRAHRPSSKRKPRGAGGSQAVIHARKEDAVARS